MAKRKKNLLDNVFDRVDDVSRDVRRAGRRTLGSSRKKKKRSTRRLAKRNNEELQALTEQVSLLVQHMAQRQGGNMRESGPSTAPIARQS